jgi:hypothetical protein
MTGPVETDAMGDPGGVPPQRNITVKLDPHPAPGSPASQPPSLRPGLRPGGRRTLRPRHPGGPRRHRRGFLRFCPQHGCSISWQAWPAMTQPSAGANRDAAARARRRPRSRQWPARVRGNHAIARQSNDDQPFCIAQVLETREVTLDPGVSADTPVVRCQRIGAIASVSVHPRPPPRPPTSACPAPSSGNSCAADPARSPQPRSQSRRPAASRTRAQQQR